MDIITIDKNLAIPINKIDYVKLNEDECVVYIVTHDTGHRVSFDEIDEAEHFYETVLEMIHKLK